MTRTTLQLLRDDLKHLLITSTSNRGGTDEDHGDLIDYSIIPIIEALSQHPEFVPTGSCFGHSGDPFLSLVFASESTGTQYLRRFQQLGMLAVKSDEYRM